MNNANEPAFPTIEKMESWASRDGDGQTFGVEYAGGLTKREYFAAMAMQGYCASRSTMLSPLMAAAAIADADALLAALAVP